MKKLNKPILSAMFIAIGLVLPFFTGQIKQIGNMLLPMHIPVMLCSFICGWKYGFLVGFILPLLRSALFGMPVMFPSAVAMAFELASYGFMAGFLYRKLSLGKWADIYLPLIISMIFGRVVWGIVQMLLLGAESFGMSAFIAGAILKALPGIIAQLIIIPAIVAMFNRQNISR